MDHYLEKNSNTNVRQIRLGKTVLQKNQIRKQLLEEVNELLVRLEQVEAVASPAQHQAKQSYQQMIHQRCNTLALLCAG